MNINALHDLLLSLEEAVIKMNKAGSQLKTFQKDYPELFKHGCEMLGAADMSQDWIKGINKEIDAHLINSTKSVTRYT